MATVARNPPTSAYLCADVCSRPFLGVCGCWLSDHLHTSLIIISSNIFCTQDWILCNSIVSWPFSKFGGRSLGLPAVLVLWLLCLVTASVSGCSSLSEESATLTHVRITETADDDEIPNQLLLTWHSQVATKAEYVKLHNDSIPGRVAMVKEDI